VVVDGEVDGLGQLVGTELHQLAGGERHGRQREHRRVPAAGGDVERVEQAAVDLVGERDRGDEVRRAGTFGLGDGETRCDGAAGMGRLAPDIEVVEVIVARRGAVGEGRERRRGAPVGADHGLVAARGGKRDIAADADRTLVEGRDPASQRVDEMGLDGFDGRFVEIAIAQAVGIGGEPLGERAGVRRRCPRPRREPAPSERRHAGEDVSARDRRIRERRARKWHVRERRVLE